MQNIIQFDLSTPIFSSAFVHLQLEFSDNQDNLKSIEKLLEKPKDLEQKS